MSVTHSKAQPSPVAPSDPLLPWSLSTDSVLEALGSDSTQGLTAAEATQRLRQYGPNTI